MVGIYKITNKINNKSYIGQSIDIERRWKSHKTEPFNPNSTQYNTIFYKAIRKYGIKNFIFEILEECPQEQLNEREQYWIEYYATYTQQTNANGYNMTIGGQAPSFLYNTEDILNLWNEGKTISDIARVLNCNVATIASRLEMNNISKKDRLYRANAYKAVPVEQYTLNGDFVAEYPSISAAVRSLNEDANGDTSNICYTCEHKLTSAYHFIWKYKTDDIPIEKLVNQVKAKVHHGQQKVSQYDKDGNFIKTFNTIKEAAQAVGLKSISAITNACTGLSKTSKGFIWKYAN